MERIKNFDEFYDVKLQPCLESLKKQNRNAGRWGIAIVVAALLFIPAIVVGLSEYSGSAGGWIIAWALASLVLCIYNYTRLNDEYESRFKEQIVKQIINFIHPGLIYKPELCVNSINYKQSSLYRSYYDDYDGDDLVEGTYKNVHFKCSDLHVSKRNGHSIFRGLFFVAQLQPGFSGGTYIWQKGKEELPVSIADERYRLLPMPHTVMANCRNGEFEKYYAVYTTNRHEAAAIVNEAMMQHIMEFRKQINRDFVLSFVAGVCYVAIPFKKNLLQPDSNNPGNKNEIKEYFFTILLILSIINKLHLDRL